MISRLRGKFEGPRSPLLDARATKPCLQIREFVRDDGSRVRRIGFSVSGGSDQKQGKFGSAYEGARDVKRKEVWKLGDEVLKNMAPRTVILGDSGNRCLAWAGRLRLYFALCVHYFNLFQPPRPNPGETSRREISSEGIKVACVVGA